MADNLTITLLVDQSPEDAYAAINNVRGWWGAGIEESTNRLHDEFTYRYKDLHYSKHKLVEMVPGERVVWLTTDSALSFVDPANEWTGTQVIFDISREGEQTQLRFTHEGLTPAVVCFDACSKGWGHYLHNSLLLLITTGQGKPSPKEDSM